MPRLRRGVLDYDRRHGYRGPGGATSSLPDAAAELEAALERAFQDAADSDGPARRRWSWRRRPTEVAAVLADGEAVKVTGDGLRFAARIAGRQGSARDRGIRRGAVIRLARDDKGAGTIAQLPQAEAGVRLRPAPTTARSVSLVGGFDFDRNKFNHVTQA